MRWYEYKMEVDDLTAPDDLKAKLLAMTDTLTAEEKAEPMMATPAPQTAAPAAPLNTETKKKKPIHFPVKQLGTLAACLAVCVLGYSTLHLGIGMGSAKAARPPCTQPKALPTAPLPLWQQAGLISSMPRWTAPPRR